MKNRNFIKNSIAILLPISMGIGVLFGTANRHVNSASAYTKDGTLPTTIDLRDNTAQEIKNYYSGLSGLSSSELQGNNLLKKLKPILKNGQKYFAYDSSGDDIWKMYEIIDRDWEKSPASAITGYSASTNKITGYTYGTSTSNKGTNPYIHALYVDRNVDNQTRAWDDHSQSQWGINREHIWPKSQGFNAEGAGGARGDPMHLWAGNGRVNGTEHNNNMYGFVDKSKSYTNPYDAKSFKNLKDNYSGKSLTIPTSTDTVFEPQDCDKGDIARAIFYMVARYNNIAGNDTIDTNNPNLALKQTTQSLSSYTTTSSNKQTGYMGLMTDLLYWNHLDPVDEFEIHRNNLLFNNYTHNRNPFIDYPEWADYIWGKPVYNGRNYVSYSSTPTGSVNLSTDVINGFKGEQPAETTVTSIEVTSKPTKLVYNVGETLDTTGMVVKVHLSNNTTRILSASDYTVTPSGTLKTTDTQATITYEGKSTSFAIAVKSSGGSTTTPAAVGTVLLEETFIDFKAIATPTKNGTNTTVYNNATVTYKCNDGGSATKIYNETYAGGTSPEILISNNNGSFVISNVPTGNAEEMTLTYKSNNENNSVSTTSTDYSVSGSPKNYTFSLKSGCTAPETISISIDNSKGSNTRVDDIKLVVKTAGTSGSTNVDVSSITLNKNSATMEIGTSEQLSATISPGDATIKLVSWSSSNSSVVEVSDEGEITAKSPGNATITCSALDGSDVTATCTITVNAPVTLESITLSGEYPTEFYLGDPFSSDGLIVAANYSDNTHIDVTDDVEITGYDMDAAGEQTVSVTYGDKTVTYQIEIKEKGLDDNQVLFVPSDYGLVNSDDLESYENSIITLTFNKNEGLQPKYYSSSTSFRVYAKNTVVITGTKNIKKIEFEMGSNSTTMSANVGTLTDSVWTGDSNAVTFTINGTSGKMNFKSIKVTYNKNSQEIAALSSISLSGTHKTEFFKDDTFNYAGLVVTAHYSNNTEKVVTPTSVSTPTMTTTGTKTVTVTYIENSITKTATYQITVKGSINSLNTFNNTKTSSVNIATFTQQEFLEIVETQGIDIITGYKNSTNAYIGGNGGSGDTVWNIWDSLKIGKNSAGGAITLTLNNSIDFKSIKIKAIGSRDDGTLSINGITKDVSKKATKTDLEPIELVYPLVGPLNEITLASKTSSSNNYSICIISIEFSSEEVKNNNYSLVTNVSDLRTGDKIVIAAPNTRNNITSYYTLSTKRNVPSTIYGCEVSFNNNIINPTDKTELITVERDGDDLSFKLSDGKYLASKVNSSVYINSTDVVDSNSVPSAKFIVTANDDNTNSMKFISKDVDTNYRRLRFLYNNGSLFYRFETTNSEAGVDPMIFKYQPQVEADTWAKEFLAKTEFCDLTHWSSLASSYSQLSNAAKEEIYSVVSDPSTDMNYRAQAMARYEKTLSVKSAEAFISEREVNLARPISLPIVAPNKETILIVVFALIGVSAIGGYYFIKRKKEDFS